VFPRYDLEAQFLAMRLVGERGVPVPRTRWLELDEGVLGGAFFVMDRVEGRVPPDNLPYTFGSWLLDATEEERAELRDETLRVLACIHSIDVAELEAEGRDLSFLRRATDGDATPPTGSDDAGGVVALRRHVEQTWSYYEWMRGDRRYPLIEDSFAWLGDHWPADEGDTVISWGDARIGNVMYDGFEPVAVLDWEMVALGPRGVDLGWFSFIHTFFQDITEVMELPGMPDFLRLEDVGEAYARVGGVPVGDLAFYEVYAALRHAVVMARVHQRQVHFGETPAVDDPDDAIMHRARLAQLIS
jgi:aminoglycoside phosphotransferase (APT) family kinase protein